MDAPPLTPLASAVLHVPVPERALVLGCGNGEAVLFLAREFPAARVRGVDPSEALIREARSRIGLDPEGRVAFKVAASGALPYPDDHFDLVAQLDGRPAIAEIARVLRPGAHLIRTGPRRSRFASSVAEALRQRRLARWGIGPVQTGQVGGGNFYVGRLRPDG
ncbi:MAG TPA: class I SAM-dependent methyltransferase [Solirubrobacterales bacterium]|nr:class I SAM-dependent methyltransferase [Solirubrobacterales bacterium]